jgi:transcriptional regulator with XRE-family HTH domain
MEIETQNETEIEFNKLLKQLRLDNNLSLRKLAEKMGYSPMYLCQLENNVRKVKSIDLIERYAEAFDIPVIDLVSCYFEFKESEIKEI